MNLGQTHFWGGFQILWGNSSSNMDSLKSAHPEWNLKKLKQTHSDRCIFVHKNSDCSSIEGDALIAVDSGIGLCISTADCLPVMLIQPSTGYFGGIHAGWRGVANRIVPKTISQLIESSGSAAPLLIWVGPHIQESSFEVGDEVGREILSSLKQISSPLSRNAGNKTHINLAAVVKQQVQESGFNHESFWISPADTKTNLNYHSYRRDRENSGRQISLIFKA